MLLYHWNLELSDIPKKNRDGGEDAMEMGKEGKEHYLNMNTLNYTILGCT